MKRKGCGAFLHGIITPLLSNSKIILIITLRKANFYLYNYIRHQTIKSNENVIRTR